MQTRLCLGLKLGDCVLFYAHTHISHLHAQTRKPAHTEARKRMAWGHLLYC